MIPFLPFFVSIVGERAAKPFAIGSAIILIVGATLLLSHCLGGNHAAERQAEQTSASGSAIAAAGANAVETVTNRASSDRAADIATEQTNKEIANASDPDAQRRALLRRLCQKPSHRLDPACGVR